MNLTEYIKPAGIVMREMQKTAGSTDPSSAKIHGRGEFFGSDRRPLGESVPVESFADAIEELAPIHFPHMNEDSYRAWDTWLKVVGIAGIAIGGIFTYWQYFDGVERQERTALIEAQKPFLAQRQELYGQAAKAVATLSTSDDAKTLAEAEATFWSLYWGQLATVESERVEAIMVQIGNCLQDPKCAKRRQLSLDLAHAIREESAQAWDVFLPALNRREQSSR